MFTGEKHTVYRVQRLLAKELELTLNYINYNLLIFNCLVLLLSQIYIMVVVASF